jgi:hypothetical protein
MALEICTREGYLAVLVAFCSFDIPPPDDSRQIRLHEKNGEANLHTLAVEVPA